MIDPKHRVLTWQTGQDNKTNGRRMARRMERASQALLLNALLLHHD
jgi:hypothetical protein